MSFPLTFGLSYADPDASRSDTFACTCFCVINRYIDGDIEILPHRLDLGGKFKLCASDPFVREKALGVLNVLSYHEIGPDVTNSSITLWHVTFPDGQNVAVPCFRDAVFAMFSFVST
jgi:hypothetical protein